MFAPAGLTVRLSRIRSPVVPMSTGRRVEGTSSLRWTARLRPDLQLTALARSDLTPVRECLYCRLGTAAGSPLRNARRNRTDEAGEHCQQHEGRVAIQQRRLQWRRTAAAGRHPHFGAGLRTFPGSPLRYLTQTLTTPINVLSKRMWAIRSRDTGLDNGMFASAQPLSVVAFPMNKSPALRYP
jgi:hypothetical protein